MWSFQIARDAFLVSKGIKPQYKKDQEKQSMINNLQRYIRQKEGV